MHSRTATILVVLLVSLVASDADAQQRRRKITWVNPDIPQMKGLVHKVLHSKSMGHDVGYVVWTPPGLDESGKTRYPVILFFARRRRFGEVRLRRVLITSGCRNSQAELSTIDLRLSQWRTERLSRQSGVDDYRRIDSVN